ncbi:MAG: prepilin peptidase, partial [Candidatus Roizmanbacteria bacterium]
MSLIFLFIFGLVVGSFLNVLIDRLSNEESILGRSYCDSCKKTLSPLTLIPVFSWIYLRGRSACCKKKISLWYPVVEIITAVAFILPFIIPTSSQYFVTDLVRLFSAHSHSTQLWFYLTTWLLLISASIVTIVADVKYHIIPDEMTLLTGLIAFPFIYLNWNHVSGPLSSPFVGALAVMFPILFLHLVTRGKGMGFGDVKYAFVMGLWLGLWDGLLALYLAFVLGGVVGIFYLLLGKKKMKSTIAFGPFLVVCFLAMIL